MVQGLLITVTRRRYCQAVLTGSDSSADALEANSRRVKLDHVSEFGAESCNAGSWYVPCGYSALTSPEISAKAHPPDFMGRERPPNEIWKMSNHGVYVRRPRRLHCITFAISEAIPMTILDKIEYDGTASNIQCRGFGHST
jgi:hypothetical protein